MNLQRHREPGAFGIDLGRVGDQRLIPDGEIVGALDPSRDPLLVLGVRLPACQPFGVRGLQPGLDHGVVERYELLSMETELVIELGHLPGLTGLRVRLRISGCIIGSDADLVAADVVGVRIAAVLVVGGHHLRSKPPDHLDQPPDLDLQIGQREAAGRQRGKRIALRQTRVDEAEPDLFDAQDLPGPVHLGTTDLGDVGQHVRPVHRRIEDGTTLSTGTGSDHNLDTFSHIAGRRGRAFARFVVGVGVDVQQSQALAGGVQPQRGSFHEGPCCHPERVSVGNDR